MKNVSKYFFSVLALLIIAGLVWYFIRIVVYILLSVVFSLVGQPFVKLFRKIRIGKRSMPSAVSALGAMICIYLILFSFSALFFPIVIEEVRIIASVDTQHLLNSLKEPINNVEYFLKSFITDNQRDSFQDYVQTKLLSFLNFTKVSDFFNQFLSIVGDLLVAIFSISFITFFFLRDEKLFYNGVLLFTPSKYETEAKNILYESKQLLIRYFIGILLEILLIVILVAVGLSLLGIKNAVIIAIFSGILNIIPYVGPLIGLMIGLVIGISTNVGVDYYSIAPLVGEISAVFIAVQLLDGLLFAPLIYSNTVRAHPLEIFIVLLIAGNIGGISAMILAIPTYTVIRIIAKQFFNNFKVVQRLTKNMNK